MGIFGSRKPPSTAVDLPFGGAVSQPTVNLAFGDVGGTGDKIRALAASLKAAGGNQQGANAINAQIMARQQRLDEMGQQALENAWRQQQLQRQNRPQVVPLGNGGVATWDDRNGLSVLREPENEVDPTALERQISFLRTLNPKLSDDEAFKIASRSMAGYAYSPEAQQQKIATAGAVADAQGAAREAHRAPATSPAAKLPAGFILD